MSCAARSIRSLSGHRLRASRLPRRVSPLRGPGWCGRTAQTGTSLMRAPRRRPRGSRLPCSTCCRRPTSACRRASSWWTGRAWVGSSGATRTPRTSSPCRSISNEQEIALVPRGARQPDQARVRGRPGARSRRLARPPRRACRRPHPRVARRHRRHARARPRGRPDTGRAGIWSDGTATTWFDDLHVEDAPETRPMRVLVVEDEPDLARVLARSLTGGGIRRGHRRRRRGRPLPHTRDPVRRGRARPDVAAARRMERARGGARRWDSAADPGADGARPAGRPRPRAEPRRR